MSDHEATVFAAGAVKPFWRMRYWTSTSVPIGVYW